VYGSTGKRNRENTERGANSSVGNSLGSIIDIQVFPDDRGGGGKQKVYLISYFTTPESLKERGNSTGGCKAKGRRK